MRENGKTGSRPSRLVGNFPHFHAPEFTQRSRRNLPPMDSSQVSRSSYSPNPTQDTLSTLAMLY